MPKLTTDVAPKSIGDVFSVADQWRIMAYKWVHLFDIDIRRFGIV